MHDNGVLFLLAFQRHHRSIDLGSHDRVCNSKRDSMFCAFCFRTSPRQPLLASPWMILSLRAVLVPIFTPLVIELGNTIPKSVAINTEKYEREALYLYTFASVRAARFGFIGRLDCVGGLLKKMMKRYMVHVKDGRGG